MSAAKRYRQEWEKRFKCDILDKYYEGVQWRSQETLASNPYVINKIYETIQIKIAQFIPTFPQFLVHSRTQAEDDLEAAAGSAQLKEDVLNTLIQNPQAHFSEEAEQAYKDSFFRFGILEVGYEADWIINPNAPKPQLGKDKDQNLPSPARTRVVFEPPELPIEERIYFKHVPAKTFFIGGQDHKYLSRCGWCGYFEYVDRDDLLSLKIKNKDKVGSAIGSSFSEPNREGTPTESDRAKLNSLRVWHIWDNRASVRFLILDSPTLVLYERKFKRLPLFDLRPDRRLITNGFYPIPPAFQWLSPQDEYNETREQIRAHRRRFIRKFQVVEGRVDDEEIEKFETGPDGALIKVKVPDAISPIQNADLGASLNEAIATSADDLNRISGTSDESRGVADRTTATQATIVNQRTALRETKERDRIVRWLCQVGRECLLLVNEKFTGRILAKLNSGEGEIFGGTVQVVKPVYKYIESEDLRDGYDFRIDVDLTSMSSASQVQEKQHLIEFLTVLTQFPMISFSPYLVREAAYRIGFRNEKAIAEMQKMSLLMEAARMNQLQQAVGQFQMPQPGNAGQQIANQMNSPDQETIRNQIQNQLTSGQQIQ